MIEMAKLASKLISKRGSCLPTQTPKTGRAALS
jgi:hypothetical protein